jgi:hypothetical protein
MRAAREVSSISSTRWKWSMSTVTAARRLSGTRTPQTTVVAPP